MKTLKFVLIVLAASLFIVTGCNKDDEAITADDMIEFSEDEATADDMFDDLVTQSEKYQDSGEKVGEKGCEPAVTYSGSEFPRTVTIDYGTEGCEGYYGHIRKGKIILTVSAPFWETGSVKTITTEDFTIDDFLIEGTKKVTNMGDNEDGNFYQTVEIIGGKITSPEGNVITRESTRTREWVEGDDTLFNIFDDKWKITGEASGINSRGISYTATITEPLIFYNGCRWKLVEGEITIEIPEHTSVINYGSGSCDNDITVTVDGVEHSVNRRR